MESQTNQGQENTKRPQDVQSDPKRNPPAQDPKHSGEKKDRDEKDSKRDPQHNK